MKASFFRIGEIVGFALFLYAAVHSADVDSSHIIFHYHGADSTSRIGESIMSLGDINSDGFDDVALSSRSPRGIFVFYGGDPPDTIPDMFFPDGWSSVGMVDLDRDHIGDYVMDDIFWNNNAGVIYFFKGYGDSLSSVPYDSLLAGSVFGGIFSCRVGYVDGDSLGDLLYQKDIPGEGSVYMFYSGYPQIDKETDWQYAVKGYEFQYGGHDFIDFNGDGTTDLCLGMLESQDTLGYIYIFEGPAFASNPDIIIQRPAFIDGTNNLTYFPQNVKNVGDYNGDGWDDVGVSYVDGFGQAMIYCGGPSYDTLFDFRLGAPAGDISYAGDINADGYDDIICGGAGGFWGNVYLYAGGPWADTIPDEEFGEEILPPLFLDDVGRRVVSAGDFNGDGFDDIMFSCKNFSGGWYGDVFIIEGYSDIITSAEGHTYSPIPDRVELYQNYPNPFNSGTAIEFNIPRGGYTEIEIFNILGELIATPLRRYLAAGEHRVAWDGRDDSGNPMPTGIYFYRVTSGDYSETKKMMLLK